MNLWVNEMSSDNPQISVEKIKIGCPSCKSKLNIPSNHIGKVSCPSCLQVFPFNSESEKAKIVAKHEKLRIRFSTDQRFWKGLIIPVMSPIIMYILLATEVIKGSSSPDIQGLFLFVGSFCLWPVIGFSLAYSSGTFVRVFREGAQISAFIGLIIAIVVCMMFLSLVSSGITN